MLCEFISCWVIVSHALPLPSEIQKVRTIIVSSTALMRLYMEFHEKGNGTCVEIKQHTNVRGKEYGPPGLKILQSKKTWLPLHQNQTSEEFAKWLKESHLRNSWKTLFFHLESKRGISWGFWKIQAILFICQLTFGHPEPMSSDTGKGRAMHCWHSARRGNFVRLANGKCCGWNLAWLLSFSSDAHFHLLFLQVLVFFVCSLFSVPIVFCMADLVGLIYAGFVIFGGVVGYVKAGWLYFSPYIPWITNFGTNFIKS